MALTPFDPADYLDTEESRVALLNEALVQKDVDILLEVLDAIARSRGMTKVARASNMPRESVYQALTPGNDIRHSTLVKIMAALGYRLAAVPAAEQDSVAETAGEGFASPA